jgi:hypothetical protein
LLTPQGATRRQFWTKAERIRVTLRLPRSIVAWHPGGLPPLLDEVEWLLTVSPDGPPVVLHELPPHGALEGQAVGGSCAQIQAAGYGMAIPWEAVAVSVPRAGMEFGVDIQVMDRKGGTWEWRPDFSGARLRLVP